MTGKIPTIIMAKDFFSKCFDSDTVIIMDDPKDKFCMCRGFWFSDCVVKWITEHILCPISVIRWGDELVCWIDRSGNNE